MEKEYEQWRDSLIIEYGHIKGAIKKAEAFLKTKERAIEKAIVILNGEYPVEKKVAPSGALAIEATKTLFDIANAELMRRQLEIMHKYLEIIRERAYFNGINVRRAEYADE